MSYRPRFEVGEKVDYGYVINRQLDRVAEARTRWDRTEIGDADYLLNYVYALEGLHALLLPELKGDAGEMLRAARSLSSYVRARFITCESSSKNAEECRKVSQEMSDLMESIRTRFGLSNTKSPKALTLELCDRALESMLVRLNNAGLLLRGRSVKVGSVRGEAGDYGRPNP